MASRWIMIRLDLFNNQKAPCGFTGSLTTLIPSFLTILIENEVWLITNLSRIELRHLSMIFRPSYSVRSALWSVSRTEETRYSA